MKLLSFILFFFFLLLLPLASQTPIQSPQSLLEMLGEELAALVPNHEGAPSSTPQDSSSRILSKQPSLLLRDILGPSAPPAERAWALLLNNLLNTQKKFRRAKKFMAPQGCFGIKLDRIGTLSGLGC